MLGGIMTPIVPAAAVIAAAKPASYFLSFIEGIIKDPMAETVAGPEPEMAARTCRQGPSPWQVLPTM